MSQAAELERLRERLSALETENLALREAEALQRHAREVAEDANRLKDQFVNLVVHDLRSPLASIIAMLDVALQEGDRLGEEPREVLQSARQQGVKLTAVIEELLGISRLRTGKIVVKPEFLDGRYLVEEVVHRLHHLARGKGVSLSNQVPPNRRVCGDPTLLGEVLQNLVSNAIKFSHAGGEVVVFAPNAEASILAVRDWGVGIDPGQCQKLFRIEEKVSTVGTAGELGAGFGLPYSHDIVAAHQGRLWVESAPGLGSTFFVELPYRQPVVLVVDDHDLDRLVVKGVLASLEVAVLEAANGEQALALMRARRPDLIICDIMMPVMDGFAFLQAVNDRPELAGVPIVMVTGDEQVETRHRAFRLGAVDFTVKPLVVHDFLPRIRRVVG